jgi:ribosomal protein S27E
MDELTQDSQKLAKYRLLFGGVDQGTANEYTLKKEEMQQTERIENKKLDFEQEKWKYEKENSGKTIEQVKDLVKVVTEGPVGEVLKNFGSAGADRLRSGGQKPPSNIVQVKCPSCGGTFPANGQLPTVACPLCGVTLQAPSQPSPPQPSIENQPQKSQGDELTVEQGQQPTSQ